MNMAQILKEATKLAQEFSNKTKKEVTARVEADEITFVFEVHPADTNGTAQPFTPVAIQMAKKDHLPIKDGTIEIIGKGINWHTIKQQASKKLNNWYEDVIANTMQQ